MTEKQLWNYAPRIVVLLAVATASIGCSSVYRPKDLPSELQAPPPTDANNVDLTRLSTTAVASDRIQAGDVLEITIISGYSERQPLRTPVRVDDRGIVSVPFIGAVSVAGFDLGGAEQAIRTEAITRGLYRNPHVSVVLDKKKTNRVTVLGPGVEKPGTFELPSGNTDLLSALVAAGGLTERANTHIEVRSPGRHATKLVQRENPQYPGQLVNYEEPVFEPPKSARINLAAASQSGQGTPLTDGDVVMVGRRELKPIHVLGLVNKPGQYELPPDKDTHVLDAIALAGGLDSPLANKIYIIRRLPGQEEAAVIKVNMSQAKFNGKENLALAAGDVVSVEQTVLTAGLDAFQKFVRIAVGGSVRIY
jgi:polysaccharide export outer membrane protein